MSIPMLINGAECGPVNPLQGLAKRFDQDRGLQQDHFGAGRAGPSREAFRTEQQARAGLAQDAAQFFSGGQSSSSPGVAAPSAFDFAAIRSSLPAVPHSHAPVLSAAQSQAMQPLAPVASWASDFMGQSAKQPGVASPLHAMSPQNEMMHEQQQSQGFQQPQDFSAPLRFHSQMPMLHANSMQTFSPPPVVQNQHHAVQLDQKLLEDQFQSHDIAQNTTVHSEPVATQETSQAARAQDADALSRTAGLLIDAVQHDKSAKFQKSEFLGLMRQLRDREMVVEGNTMVPNTQSSQQQLSGWANDFATADVKGKGKAVDRSQAPGLLGKPVQGSFPAYQLPALQRAQEIPGTTSESASDVEAASQDPNEAYFNQENKEFAEYWRDHYTTRQAASPADQALEKEWANMQQDWDAFEATASGLRAVSGYQFQPGNPYLLGERSTTHNHLMHGTQERQSFFESVLQLEAAVQREPQNARAWFELGVKQQENERETKAIQALRRAVELDPEHLPPWLALAVSQTNEGDRLGTHDAVQEWVNRNERYRAVVAAHWAALGKTRADNVEDLIGCLITMAQSDAGGAIDADIQVALAVLLNTNEEYGKAQDCFRTALSVRPEDWLLYNRVGATLANSGHADEAISYYYRALELNPAYIRARFNLGISCINLRRYAEAAQHILDALVLQDSDRVGESDGNRGGVTSSALWDSLRTTSLHMQRADLATLCDQRDLDGACPRL
ncbi:TPR-like protein [Dentipellis sp. KUC8613]|nr:TPR-like protein [Dentipellis sp. KUC8613]